MNLKEILIDKLDIDTLEIKKLIMDLPYLRITNDSRDICENTIYFDSFKGKYLKNALEKHPFLVVGSSFCNLQANLTPFLIRENSNQLYHEIINEHLKTIKARIIGITGTSGKTSTATLLYYAFKYFNKKCLFIGTHQILSYIGGKEERRETNNTTPDLQVIYNELIKDHFDYCVMEVSSEGLFYGRVDPILFDVACFLNCTKEHMITHQNMDNYFNTKCKLFKKLKEEGVAFINIDDEYGKRLYDSLPNNKISIGSTNCDYTINPKSNTLSNSIFYLNDEMIEIPFGAKYMMYNFSFAITILKYFGYSFEIIKKFYCNQNNYHLDGRLEFIKTKKGNIVIDYAHTIEEVKQTLKFLRKNSSNNLIVVIGCGGNRDIQKRSIIGALCTTYASWTIFTEDNSRTEPFEEIINNIISGCENKNYEIIRKREDAIFKAMSIMNHEDTVCLLGKGNETVMIDKDIRCYSEKAVVGNIIKELELI